MNHFEFWGHFIDFVNLVYLKLVRELKLKNLSYIRNYFKTDFNKNVLICYVVEPFILPFRGNRFYMHSNQAEALEIASIFRDLGYNVDVVQYEDISVVTPYNYYDIIFGHVPNLNRFAITSPKALVIYYITGSYCRYRNRAEKKRIDALLRRRHLPSGYLKSQWSNLVDDVSTFKYADRAICIGDEITRKTHPPKIRKITSLITISSFSFFPWTLLKKEKEFAQAKSNFLCMISSAPVHKGLDLLLEVFSKLPHLNLYIAGNISTDPQFVKAYENELFNTPNIHYVGWVSIRSTKFRQLSLKCVAALLLSASEGVNGAIPTCMHTGLIPIVTKGTSIITKECGYTLGSVSPSTIRAILRKVSHLSESELKRMSSLSSRTAEKYYSMKRFKSDFSKELLRIIKYHKNSSH